MVSPCSVLKRKEAGNTKIAGNQKQTVLTVKNRILYQNDFR